MASSNCPRRSGFTAANIHVFDSGGCAALECGSLLPPWGGRGAVGQIPDFTPYPAHPKAVASHRTPKSAQAPHGLQLAEGQREPQDDRAADEGEQTEEGA